MEENRFGIKIYNPRNLKVYDVSLRNCIDRFNFNNIINMNRFINYNKFGIYIKKNIKENRFGIKRSDARSFDDNIDFNNCVYFTVIKYNNGISTIMIRRRINFNSFGIKIIKCYERE